MFNPRKDFEKRANKILGEYLKTQGFKRFKTRNFIRVTTDYFLQIINFQKSAGFAYYININSIPLSSVQYSFFAEGGARIQNLYPDFIHDDSTGRFEFGNEYLLVQNLNEILEFIKSKGIYWLDLVGNSDTFMQYENEAEIKKDYYPLLKKHVNRELDLTFLMLQCEKYDEAKDYLLNLKELLHEKGDKFYLNRHKDTIDSLLLMLKHSNIDSIKNTIERNINESIQNLALGKIKLHQVDCINLTEFKEKEYVGLKINAIPGSGGVEHYHQILDGDITMFQALKKRFEVDFELVVISDLRFALKYSEKGSFHFVHNSFETVKDDIVEICQWHERKGLDLSQLLGQSTRIDFWCDHTYQDNVSSYAIRDKINKIIHDEFSNLIYIPGQYKFIE